MTTRMTVRMLLGTVCAAAVAGCGVPVGETREIATVNPGGPIDFVLAGGDVSFTTRDGENARRMHRVTLDGRVIDEGPLLDRDARLLFADAEHAYVRGAQGIGRVAKGVAGALWVDLDGYTAEGLTLLPNGRALAWTGRSLYEIDFGSATSTLLVVPGRIQETVNFAVVADGSTYVLLSGSSGRQTVARVDVEQDTVTNVASLPIARDVNARLAMTVRDGELRFVAHGHALHRYVFGAPGSEPVASLPAAEQFAFGPGFTYAITTDRAFACMKFDCTPARTGSTHRALDDGWFVGTSDIPRTEGLVVIGADGLGLWTLERTPEGSGRLLLTPHTAE